MGFEIVRVTCRGWYGSSQPWFRIVREMLAANRSLRRRRWQASARHHLRTTGGSLWQHSSSSQLENSFLIRVLLSFFPTPDCSSTSSCCKAALLVSDDTKHLQRDVHMPLALHDDDAKSVYLPSRRRPGDLKKRNTVFKIVFSKAAEASLGSLSSLRGSKVLCNTKRGETGSSHRQER